MIQKTPILEKDQARCDAPGLNAQTKPNNNGSYYRRPLITGKRNYLPLITELIGDNRSKICILESGPSSSMRSTMGRPSGRKDTIA